MLCLTFLDESKLNILRKAKGQVFYSITGDDWYEDGSSVGDILLSIGQQLIVISNDYIMCQFLGYPDEECRIDLVEITNKDDYKNQNTVITQKVNQRIVDIQVIRDNIQIFDKKDKLLQTIDLDRSFIFQLNNKNELSITLDNSFTPITDIRIGQTLINYLPSVEEVTQEWTDTDDDKEYYALVKRFSIQL